MREKKKFYLFVIASVFLAVAVYFLVIKNTLSLRNRLNKIDNQKFSVGQLTNQLLELDERLLKSKLSSTILAEKANLFMLEYDSESFVVQEIKPPHLIKKGDLNVQTYSLSFRSNYIEALRFIYFLEQQEKIPISSIKMDLKKIKKENHNKQKLITTIFIQNITTHEKME